MLDAPYYGRTMRNQFKRNRGRGRLRRIGMVAAVGLTGVLALAWMDGGEEPVHPIMVEIERPVPADMPAGAAR